MSDRTKELIERIKLSGRVASLEYGHQRLFILSMRRPRSLSTDVHYQKCGGGRRIIRKSLEA